ncbi:dephospho-CoA kinase [Carnobacterium divergens]|uniref:dephospho-CoA kinase n=1 Tax=Carnobacterium divergens TaxID=2748 RepID=UPI0007F3DB60|nr:dephospho-CoA kinase [Carnobacterium divergens]SBO18108.1 dephosphocoenzyme A kinase [Carnobacterium divergens]
MTVILGLTGSIATGKSTVSQLFKDFGFPVVDADLGARAVVEKGTAGLRAIKTYFGDEIIHSDGSLNRQKLGKIVFEDGEKRKQLNELLKPYIRKWIMDETQKQVAKGVSLVVLDIPLLYEAEYDKVVDMVMVVAVSPATQLKRLQKRNQLSKEEALLRIYSQKSIVEKEQLADIVIDNNGSKESTKQQVEKWLGQMGFLSIKG